MDAAKLLREQLQQNTETLAEKRKKFGANALLQENRTQDKKPAKARRKNKANSKAKIHSNDYKAKHLNNVPLICWDLQEKYENLVDTINDEITDGNYLELHKMEKNFILKYIAGMEDNIKELEMILHSIRKNK